MENITLVTYLVTGRDTYVVKVGRTPECLKRNLVDLFCTFSKKSLHLNVVFFGVAGFHAWMFKCKKVTTPDSMVVGTHT